VFLSAPDITLPGQRAANFLFQRGRPLTMTSTMILVGYKSTRSHASVHDSATLSILFIHCHKPYFL
jgi:hypothetical protein